MSDQDGGAISPERIMMIGTGFFASKVTLSAVSMGLFTTLEAAGGADLAAIRRAHNLHERSARDFLDCLVALGLLLRDDAGIYSNAPESAVFLDRNKPSYVGGLLEMANARLYGFWADLDEALVTGKPQSELKHGGSFFGNLYSDPVKLKTFLSAMTGLSAGTAQAMAKKFPWADYKSVIDIGAAQGAMPATLALAHEHLEVGGFDLPAVAPVFADYLTSLGLGERVKFHAGDFFADGLPSADVLIMGHILHDWSLDEKRMLLDKAYAALPEGGALIVYEALIDDDRRQNVFGLVMSLNMLIETDDGFDYSGADCQGWMKDAGFRKTRVENLVGPEGMVVGIK